MVNGMKRRFHGMFGSRKLEWNNCSIPHLVRAGNGMKKLNNPCIQVLSVVSYNVYRKEQDDFF